MSKPLIRSCSAYLYSITQGIKNIPQYLLDAKVHGHWTIPTTYNLHYIIMICILPTSINVSEVQLTESVAASSDMIAQSRDDKIPSKASYGIPLQKLLFCCCNSEDWGRSKSRVGTLTLTTSTLRVWSISSQAVTESVRTRFVKATIQNWLLLPELRSPLKQLGF